MKKAYWFLSVFLLFGITGWVAAQQSAPTGYVQPNAVLAKKSDGTFAYMQVDGSGNLTVGSASLMAVTQGQGAPSGYVQPYALVAMDSNGAWHYVRTDTAGNLLVAGGGAVGSITLDTKGVANGSQSVLNLAEGSNVTLVDNGSGTVTIASSSTVGSDDKTGRTTSISPVTLATPSAAGVFVADIYLSCSTGQATTTVGVTVAWTDASGAQTATTIANSSSCASTGAFYVGSQVLYSDSGQAITYSTTAANFTTGAYAIHVRLRTE